MILLSLKFFFNLKSSTSKFRSRFSQMSIYRPFGTARRTSRLISFKERLETDIEEFTEKLSSQTHRSRELKWIDMLKTGLDQLRSSNSKYKLLKGRCVKGIPQSLRSQVITDYFINFNYFLN